MSMAHTTQYSKIAEKDKTSSPRTDERKDAEEQTARGRNGREESGTGKDRFPYRLIRLLPFCS